VGSETTPKLIHTVQGNVVGEVALGEDRMTFGRHATNDLQLDDTSVSGHHARILVVMGECVLQDLKSRNGTYVNDQRIDWHSLDDGDRIRIGHHELAFVGVHSQSSDPSAARDNQAVRNDEAMEPGGTAPEDKQYAPIVRILRGPNKGKKIRVRRGITPIGKSWGQVLVIIHRPDGYYVSQLEGESEVSVNGYPLENRTRILQDGDVLEIGDAEMQFNAHPQAREAE
jgi:pSer/pThr/pTyr-binding forkhead associated (FHA) protein